MEHRITWWCTVASVSVTLTGMSALQSRLQGIADASPLAVANALYEEAQTIIADSVREYVPIDTGTLAASGRVDAPVLSPSAVEVTFGFGGQAADYAIAVHENPRAGETMGVSPSGKKYRHFARRGQWKYLETPLQLRVPKVADALREALDDLAYQRSGYGSV